MGPLKFRVLVVDDFEPFRRLLSSMLQSRPDVEIIGETADGLEAVRIAHELQPDLILLDIRLTTLNGIKAARQIHELSPNSKILFVSQESSSDFVKEAFRLGASGYVIKSAVRTELPAALNTVLRGGKFLGSRFAGRVFPEL